MTATPKKEPKVFAQVDPESTIHQTTNYEKFKRMPGNRKVKPYHIEAIKKSILKKDLKTPVVINKHWELIDGQHCYEARKELGLPIYYRFGNKMDLTDVQTLNSTSLPWSNEDFCDSYIELGNKHYRTYKSFRKRFQLQHETALVLLNGRDARAMRKLFREGEFRVADLKDAERKAGMIYALRDFVPSQRQDVFVKALLIAYGRDGFSFERFLQKAKENRSMFQWWPTIDQNLLMIETVYNTGPGRKIPLRYAIKHPTMGRSKFDEEHDEPEADDKKSDEGVKGNGRAKGAVGEVAGRVSRTPAGTV